MVGSTEASGAENQGAAEPGESSSKRGEGTGAAILESLDEAQKLIQQTIHDQQTRRPSILISSLTEIDEHTRGCLTTAQIIFIEDIANMQESAIQKIPGIGGSGLAGIRKALVTRGLDFARAA